MKLNIDELIPGRVYKCLDKADKNEYILWWSRNKHERGKIVAQDSIFIFLGFAEEEFDKIVKDEKFPTVTIKGLVEGNLLYAIRCSKDYFLFEELT